MTNISKFASFFSNVSIPTTSSCSIRRIYNDLSDLKPETDKAVGLPYLTWNHNLGHRAVWFPLADLKSESRSQNCSNRFHKCFEDCIRVMKDLLCSSIVNIKCAEYCKGRSWIFQGGANPRVEGGGNLVLFGQIFFKNCMKMMKIGSRGEGGIYVDLSLYCFNFCRVHNIIYPPPDKLTSVKGA